MLNRRAACISVLYTLRKVRMHIENKKKKTTIIVVRHEWKPGSKAMTFVTLLKYLI